MTRQDPRQPELFAAMPDVRPAGERAAADRYRAPSLLDAIREAPARPATSLYPQIILCAADDVQRLRRSDVHRVISEANERGDVHGFTKWLAWQRPEYAVIISEAYAEVTGIAAGEA